MADKRACDLRIQYDHIYLSWSILLAGRLLSRTLCHWLFCRQNILRMMSVRNCSVNTDIARIVDPRRALNCQSCCYGIFAILHFVLGSHLILERNMSFLCLFVVLKSRDASFKGYFYKIFWSSSNMQLRLINPED